MEILFECDLCLGMTLITSLRIDYVLVSCRKSFWQSTPHELLLAANLHAIQAHRSSPEGSHSSESPRNIPWCQLRGLERPLLSPKSFESHTSLHHSTKPQQGNSMVSPPNTPADHHSTPTIGLKSTALARHTMVLFDWLLSLQQDPTKYASEVRHEKKLKEEAEKAEKAKKPEPEPQEGAAIPDSGPSERRHRRHRRLGRSHASRGRGALP